MNYQNKIRAKRSENSGWCKATNRTIQWQAQDQLILQNLPRSIEFNLAAKLLTRPRPKRGQKWPQARKTCSALWWEQIKISPFRWKSDVMSTMWGFKQNFSNRKCVAMVTPEWQWGHFWPHFGRACNTFSEIVINDIFYISGTVIDRNVIPNLFLIFFGSRKSSRL